MRFSSVGLLLATSVLVEAAITRNARCGSEGNGATCLGSPWGNCCSQHGWCGSAPDYCATGCQSKFGTCNRVATTSQRSSSSSSAQQTRTSSRTTSTSRSSVPVASSPSQPISNNARCGKDFGGMTCKGSRWGNCCSQYFYCGSVDAYCGPQSCQKGYGDCNHVSSSAVASTTSAAVSSSRLSSSSSASSAMSTSSSATQSSSSSQVSSSSSSSTLSSSSITSSSVSSSSSSSSSSISISSTSSSTAPIPSCTKQVVINGDFETGVMTPWQVSRPAAISPANGAAGQGNYFLQVNVNEFIQQGLDFTQPALNLPIGTPVSCSFQWANDGIFEFETEAGIYVGGQQCGGVLAGPSGFQTVTGTAKTTDASGVRVNMYYQVDETARFYLDNVSVVATLYGDDCPSGS